MFDVVGGLLDVKPREKRKEVELLHPFKLVLHIRDPLLST